MYKEYTKNENTFDFDMSNIPTQGGGPIDQQKRTSRARVRERQNSSKLGVVSSPANVESGRALKALVLKREMRKARTNKRQQDKDINSNKTGGHGRVSDHYLFPRPLSAGTVSRVASAVVHPLP